MKNMVGNSFWIGLGMWAVIGLIVVAIAYADKGPLLKNNLCAPGYEIEQELWEGACTRDASPVAGWRPTL